MTDFTSLQLVFLLALGIFGMVHEIFPTWPLRPWAVLVGMAGTGLILKWLG